MYWERSRSLDPGDVLSLTAFSLRWRKLGRLGLAFVCLLLCTAGPVTSSARGASIASRNQVKTPHPPPMRYIPGLEEALVATGPVTTEEDKDLDAALAAFHDAPFKAGPDADYDDYAQPFISFIQAHPSSHWNPALYLNLGLGYYHAGYYSRTFLYLEKAWRLGRDAETIQAHRMIDRAVGELAEMHARLGHREELEALLEEIGDRPIGGPATELLQGAREGLWTFRNHPEIAYLCGPAALGNLLLALDADPTQIKTANDAHSGPHGFSLPQLASLTEKAGLKFKLIRREAGEPVPVPSIVNWNTHHYAAIIGREGALYRLKDPTFGSGSGAPVTAKAIDEESSGYFLVPETVAEANVESGWREVSANSPEARAVYGMGTVSSSLPGATEHADKKICPQCAGNKDLGDDSSKTIAPEPQAQIKGMATASANIMAVSLSLMDTPVGYQPQKGGSALTTLSYNSREAEQPATFTFSNVGPKWTFSWCSYVQDNPSTPGSQVTRISSGGGGYDYSLVNGSPYNSSTGYFAPETYDNSQLVRIPASGEATSYQRLFPDGSVEVYGLSNGAASYPRYMFLTQVVDPAGNTTTLNYDTQFRLMSVKDAMGRSTTFTYGDASDIFLITKITDAFGRSSQLTYVDGQLTSVTDPIGITSTLTYGSATDLDFVTALTTPYGTSKFSETPNPNDPQPYFGRSLAMTDPLGYVDYLYFYQDDSVTDTPTSEAVVPTGMSNDNGILQWRNTYYWDRHASALGVTTDSNGNPTAENFAYPDIYHWLHFCCALTYASNQLGSIKKPLEEYRQWFNYPGMANSGYYYYSGTLIKPSAVGRVLDDGTTQRSNATYNSLGLPLTVIDPEGRTTTYSYAANEVDLLTVQQLTASPSIYTTIATYGHYNSQHEPQTYTGADGQTWQYTYNMAGQLSTVTDPNSYVTTYNYDSLGRLANVTNANNATALTLTYDNADRIHTWTDSQGYTLTYNYDNLDRVIRISYPDGTTDLYNYNFLSGPNEGKPSLDLRHHTDRLGRYTTYNYDADRHLTSVTEQISASQNRTTQYDYYEDGTLKDITDAKGNVTHWEIDSQSRPTSKTYAYGTSSAQTETYAYETTNSRLHSITDALGQVKTFTYAHDDRLTGFTYINAVNATPNVAFTWDSYFPRLSSMLDGLGATDYSYTPIGTLGALQLSLIDGPYSNDTIGLTYDPVGRLASRVIPGCNIETFGYDPISRLTSHYSPLGTFNYTYLGQTDQVTSRSINNGGPTISTAWGYDTNINDRRLISITNSGAARSYSLSYLTPGGTTNPYDIQSISDIAGSGNPWTSQTHSYAYDGVDRLLSATAPATGNYGYAYDKVDNATTVSMPKGPVHPTYNAFNELAAWGSKQYAYDADGNTLSGDGTRTYKWDSENRLIEIDYAGSLKKSQFSYDGLGHRTVDVETAANGGTTTTRYLWCGSHICQSRDGSDNPLRRDLEEGEVNLLNDMQPLIYMPDQLGSVRDVLDGGTGNLLDSFDYTPYGSVARTSGTTSMDYHYAGLFLHSASALNLSATRPMDGVTGRWLNRDPIGELGGTNIYSYVGENPLRSIDTMGFCCGNPYDDIADRVAGIGQPPPPAGPGVFDVLKQISGVLGDTSTLIRKEIPGLSKVDVYLNIEAYINEPSLRNGEELGQSVLGLCPQIALGEAISHAVGAGLDKYLDWIWELDPSNEPMYPRR